MAAPLLSPEGTGISREEVARRLADPSLVVVDVRASDLYAEGHIPGAINLPLADLEAGAARLLPDRERQIAVYCASPT